MTRNTLSAAATAATFALLCLGTAATAQAAPHATVVVHTGAHAPAPPGYHPGYQPVYRPGHRPHHAEAVPRPRPGQFWVAGHWQQHGRRAVWQPGHWERSRPGVHRPNHGAVPYPGHLTRPHGKPLSPRWDRDGDGIPNRDDRRPDNPNRS